jgi:nucleoside-diphosphate-sugar epimerase
MKYFVTGATGFLGNVMVRQLLAQGHQVQCMVRSPEKAREVEALGAKIFKGDVTDKESMRAAMQGTDGVFHVAGWYKVGVRDRRSHGEKINIHGTRHVLELMQELGIPKGVYTSTLAINSHTRGQLVDETHRFTGKHISEYDRTKAAAHDIAQEFIDKGLPLIIVMPGVIYGPNDTSQLGGAIINYLRRKLPVVPTHVTYAWGYVDDIAAGHLLAMEKGKIGETYHLNGEPYELIAAFRLAEEITGIPAPKAVSPKLMGAMSRLVKPLDWLMPPSYTSESLRVMAGTTYIGDNSKAKRELGFNPRPLREGLEQTLRYEMNRLGLK